MIAVEYDESELIAQAQRGNAMAFERLVYVYDRQILSLAMRHVNNAEDARDIYQEVFLRVYRALPGFRGESKFSTWLHRIATNVCLTYRSRSRKHRHESIDQGFETQDGEGLTLAETLAAPSRTDRGAQDTEISEQVEAAMQKLSPQQRLVFTLRHYKGFKLKEIASMMDCAEGTVKKHLFVANERLREQLRELV